jgi:hypothetical protein
MGSLRHGLVTFLILSVAFLCSAAGSLAGPFQDPMIPDGQMLSYRYTARRYSNPFLAEIKQGEEVDRSVTVIRSYVDEHGEKMYRVVDRGSRKNGYRLEHVTQFSVKQQSLRPVSFVARDLNQEGRTIRQMQAVFDDPSVQYPEDTFPVFSLVQAMRGACFEEGRVLEFTLWLAPTELFRVFLVVKNTEKIKVPAGTFSCHCVEMRPDIRSVLPMSALLAKLVQPFVPEYRFWFSKEPSHPLVKFDGALGGAGAVKHVIELTSIERQSEDTAFTPHAKEAGDG